MKRFFQGMQWLISSLLLCSVPSDALAQTVRYTYDASGNRISKAVASSVTRGGDFEFLESQGRNSWLGDSVIFVISQNAITVLFPYYKKTSNYHCTINTISGITVGDADIESAKRVFKVQGKAKDTYLVSVTINEETQTWKVTLR